MRRKMIVSVVTAGVGLSLLAGMGGGGDAFEPNFGPKIPSTASQDQRPAQQRERSQGAPAATDSAKDCRGAAGNSRRCRETRQK